MSTFMDKALVGEQRETKVTAHDMKDMDPRMMDGIARTVVMAIDSGVTRPGETMTLILPEFEYQDKRNGPIKESGQWGMVLRRVG